MMKSWNKTAVVFAVLLATFLCKNLLAGQEGAEKLSAVGCVAAQNPIGYMEQGDVNKSTKEGIISKTRTLQMPFVANNGQVNEQVRFYAKTFGGTVFVTKEGEIVYSLPGRDVPAGASLSPSQQDAGEQMCRGAGVRGGTAVSGWHGKAPLVRAASEYAAKVYVPFSHAGNADCQPGRVLVNALLAAYIPRLQKETSQRVVSTSTTPPNPQTAILLRGVVLKETIIGANIGVISGEQPAVTTVNYFTGNDKSKWKTNVPTYNIVNMGEVYKGIELSLRAYGDNVEKLFCVKPGASPEFIKVQLDGGKSLQVNHDGQLEADTELGPVKFTRPIAYQEIGGKRVNVAVEYTIHGPGIEGTEGRGAGEHGSRGAIETPNLKPETCNSQLVYSFTVASYDKTSDLIIDPLLASTFLGGSNGDYGYSITRDTSGNVYVTGFTDSSSFPTTIGVYDTSNNGNMDIFVSKLNSGLTSLLASTFLGGSYIETEHAAIAIDTSGNVYVTGTTWSSDFPTTNGAYDTSSYGDGDVFVSKLNSGLTSLLASTFLGGSSIDDGRTLIFDTSGNVYVAGWTYSTDFPTTPGAYDTFMEDNGTSDIFVSKLNSGLTSLLASTYLGGSADDRDGDSLTRDTSGNVYVTGNTYSADFPTTVGAYDTSFNGGEYEYDVFVSKLNSGLTGLLASTFLGGSSSDDSSSLTLDTSGNVYVTGYTVSSDFPTTIGAYDTSSNTDVDVFVSKLNSGLTGLLASTFLGGSNGDFGNSLTLDTSGNVYVTGFTGSSDFPTTIGAYDTSSNGGVDVFVSKLNSGLTGLLASTYLGGSGDDIGYSLTLDTSANVYVTGPTDSSDFPTTIGAYDTSFNGGSYDVFISKLDGALSGTGECIATSITAAPVSLKLKRIGTGSSGTVTITVTGEGGCPVEGVLVEPLLTPKANRLVGVLPGIQATDASGNAVFAISAKGRKGKAVLLFESDQAGSAMVWVAVR